MSVERLSQGQESNGAFSQFTQACSSCERSTYLEEYGTSKTAFVTISIYLRDILLCMKMNDDHIFSVFKIGIHDDVVNDGKHLLYITSIFFFFFVTK